MIRLLAPAILALGLLWYVRELAIADRAVARRRAHRLRECATEYDTELQHWRDAA